MELNKRYKGVFFDLGGTLRIAFDDEPFQRHARRKMAEIAGTDLPVEDFYQLVEDRYEPYRQWAVNDCTESNDEELWLKWLLPDYDPARIRQVCHELSFQYRQAKGRREVVDGGAEVIRILHQRGYKLGIISNLIGENEVPDWLEEDGLAQYFDSVILSSVCNVRKPSPDIYRIAGEDLGLALEDCVSVADNVKRDIPGAKLAGIGCNIIFDSPEKKHSVYVPGENAPACVIVDFRALLELLPPLD